MLAYNWIMRLAVLALVLASFGGCKKSHCLDSKTEKVSGGLRIEWVECPDEHNHVVDCNMRGEDYTCSCTPGDSFDVKLPKGATSLGSMTPEQAREGCKWDFTP
jgi:hypothetical protein